MIATGVNLKSLSNRKLKINGEDKHIEKNYIEINNYNCNPSEKSGVLRLTSDAVVGIEDRVILVALNPALFDSGEVSAKSFILPEDGDTNINVLIRPLDSNATEVIKSLSYLCRLYIIESKL